MEHEETLKITFEKCRVFCNKINSLNDEINQIDRQNSKEETIFDTFKSIIREKKEMKVNILKFLLNID